MDGAAPQGYEVDHLITPALGGSDEICDGIGYPVELVLGPPASQEKIVLDFPKRTVREAIPDEKFRYAIDVDLREQTISDGDGLTVKFELDPFRRECLLEGLDDIALTLKQADKISAYEASHPRAATTA